MAKGKGKPTVSASPRWGGTTKLAATLTILVIAGALLVRFKNVVIPVLMALMLSYLLHPLAELIHRKTSLSWRVAVNLIYLVIVILLVAVLTAGGVGLVQQIQNLITAVNHYITTIPEFVANLATKEFTIGRFTINLATLGQGTLGQQVLGTIQPALGKLGSLVGALASSALVTIGWLAFILLVSYFFLVESSGLTNSIIPIDIPGYGDDIRRLGEELGRIWNAFLRGQLIIFFSTIVVYGILFTILGVKYSFGLAVLTGFATFLPYVGPLVNWIVVGLVVLFQGTTFLGMAPLIYLLVVLGSAILIDQVFNSLVTPRIMAKALKVHPALVLIAAIISASLLGLVGVILAAPLVASLKLFGTYLFRKMMDKDPWPEAEEVNSLKEKPGLFAKALSQRGKNRRKQPRTERKPPQENSG